jgi:RNA polymerase sigma factor (sigma-70 family)
MIIADSANTATPFIKTETQTEFDFGKIYQLYWKPIFGIAYHHLRSKDLAENIVQDVFTSLWSRQSNNNNLPIRDIRAWLASAAKYAIFKQAAISQKRKTEVLENGMKQTTSHSIDILFVDRMLATEINRLPQKCKLVYQYSRENNLPNKEIAKKLNLSEKTVEKHITSALRKLRLRMKDFFLF